MMNDDQDGREPPRLPASDDGSGSQRILVLQQGNRAESKIAGIKEYGQDRFSLDVVTIESMLPPVIDDTAAYLPETIVGDLVLDYLTHPDLSYDLGRMCEQQAIPIVASGKKTRNRWVLAPPICCALPRHPHVGLYGECFGAPEFDVTIVNNRIKTISVLRGAPCGASWQAARKVPGLPVDDAVIRIGLETQFFCTADPANWDPIGGKSPVHFAGELHAGALRRALKIRDKHG